MNDFHVDLEYSLDKREDDMFSHFYYRVFPNIQKIEFCNDLSTQKRGVDKIIHFTNGNSFTIDEKKRRTDYGDILLELWSVAEKKKRGWLYYTQCDYIVYAVMPSQKVYLLPTILLKRAWITNKDKWSTRYAQRAAKNKGYTTINIPIPTGELLTAISNEMTQKMEANN